MQQLAIHHNANASNYHHFGCVDALLHRLNNYIAILIGTLFKWMCIPFKDFFASVQRASKRDNNNRTPGESTVFELGKYANNHKFFKNFELLSRRMCVCFFL